MKKVNEGGNNIPEWSGAVIDTDGTTETKEKVQSGLEHILEKLGRVSIEAPALKVEGLEEDVPEGGSVTATLNGNPFPRFSLSDPTVSAIQMQPGKNTLRMEFLDKDGNKVWDQELCAHLENGQVIIPGMLVCWFPGWNL